MKSIIKKLLAKLGFKIQRININSASTALNFKSAIQMQKHLIGNSHKEVVIFDIGAYDGGTTLGYKRHFPLARIYAFEPFPDSFSKLVKNTSNIENIITVNKGISDVEGFATFNSNSFAQTNSLLDSHKMSNKVWGNGLLDTMDKIEVEITTVDRFVSSNGILNIDILKMDVQGAEYKVVKGARETLEKGIIKLIYTEIITMPTYEGQLDFEETIKLIKSFGYELYNIYNPSLTNEGQLRQVDAIFKKTTTPLN